MKGFFKAVGVIVLVVLGGFIALQFQGPRTFLKEELGVQL